MTEVTKTNRGLVGIVVSAANDKTIVVKIDRREKHPLLGKYITKSSKIHAHDEKNVCNVGDQVNIREGRPRSKMKSWELASIIVKAAVN